MSGTRCTCGSSTDRAYSITPPGGAPRRETLCALCASQLRDAGYRVATLLASTSSSGQWPNAQRPMAACSHRVGCEHDL